jgi:hypothetical protein
LVLFVNNYLAEKLKELLKYVNEFKLDKGGKLIHEIKFVLNEMKIMGK